MNLSIQHANRVIMVSSVELPIYGRRVLVAHYRHDDNCLDVTYRSGRLKTFNAIDRTRALALLAVMMSGNPKRRWQRAGVRRTARLWRRLSPPT